MSRRWLDPETASELGQLDAAAIARVRDEAWPDPANADELHDALSWLGVLTETEVASRTNWSQWLDYLTRARRATRFCTAQESFWVAAERLPHIQALWPSAVFDPAILPPASARPCESSEQALVELVRGRLEGQGPVTSTELATTLGLDAERILSVLAALETEGFALSGRFTPGGVVQEWCERRLLARIHRYTVKRLRAEIEPVAARDYLRFLFEWQRVAPEARMEGPHALNELVEQLAGFEAPAAAWEKEILPARLATYDPAWLDDACGPCSMGPPYAA
jgi:ATP-dependent Lhr-like helicase